MSNIKEILKRAVDMIILIAIILLGIAIVGSQTVNAAIIERFVKSRAIL